MILVYAFSNNWGTNISRRTLLEFQKLTSRPDINFQIINSYPQQFFQKYIHNYQYDLIIGLGDGMSGKIRIETQAKNAYNNRSIYPFSPIFIDLSLPNLENYNPDYFCISSNMGTYNCNWMAFSTQLHLNQKNLSTSHIFLHLPPKSNASFIATQIKNLLDSSNINL